ncbi:MAG TPA: hypothetical protein VGD49_06375 [Longimicrobiales bacterium]
MIAFIDWWQLDHPDFTGARCLTDAAAANCVDASARAVARVFVLQAALAAVRDDDMGPMRFAAAGYVATLFEIDDAETGALWDCLASIRSNDAGRLARSLYEVGRVCAWRHAPGAARSFAELSYEAALAAGAWEHAHYAALLLERLAELDECHDAADRWGRRAAVFGRRVERRQRRRREDRRL